MASPDRSGLDTAGVLADIWSCVGLPSSSLASAHLPSADALAFASSYKLGVLAQSTIAASALAAAEYHALRNASAAGVPAVTVPLDHARLEFDSQRYQWLEAWDKHPPDVPDGKVGGVQPAADGWVRIHDLLPNHVAGTLRLLGLPEGSLKEQVGEKTKHWRAVDLETEGTERGGVAIYAQRTYAEWDAHPQSRAITTKPILIRQLAPGPKKILPANSTPGHTNKALSGLRVVELTRVIAGPVAGRTLAAHGADVLWVTSPNLPDVPFLDSDMSRGKRTIQLDLDDAADKATLLELLRTADVFLQGYRPESLASRGLHPEALAEINPNLIVANLSAFGPTGPWAHRRGFDSLVQTASGMTASEAAHAGEGEPQRSTPVQALDHGSGYLLATGIIAALCRRATDGGAWVVDVSLAGTMKYLRSLGQYEGRTGFVGVEEAPADIAHVPGHLVDVRQSGFGLAYSLKHCAHIDGVEVGFVEAPKPLGSDEARWKPLQDTTEL